MSQRARDSHDNDCLKAARRFVNWFDAHEDRLREQFIEADFYELQEIADRCREQLR